MYGYLEDLQDSRESEQSLVSQRHPLFEILRPTEMLSLNLDLKVIVPPPPPQGAVMTWLVVVELLKERKAGVVSGA